MSVLSDVIDRILGSGDGSNETGPEAESAEVESAAETADVPAAEAAPEHSFRLDVSARLEELQANHPEEENLEWKRSIVDLMKLVGVDSSYEIRKEMALELGYSQEDIDCHGSAEMNIWLLQQVMAKLAENGGKVPADLLE